MANVERQAAIGLGPSLGIGSSTALIVGFVIGSSIFRVPGVVAVNAGGTRAALLAWAVGGGIALCGALSLAELGAMFPRAGGVYVFLYEAYGPAVAFLKAGSISSLVPLHGARSPSCSGTTRAAFFL